MIGVNLREGALGYVVSAGLRSLVPFWDPVTAGQEDAAGSHARLSRRFINHNTLQFLSLGAGGQRIGEDFDDTFSQQCDFKKSS